MPPMNDSDSKAQVRLSYHTSTGDTKRQESRKLPQRTYFISKKRVTCPDVDGSRNNLFQVDLVIDASWVVKANNKVQRCM